MGATIVPDADGPALPRRAWRLQRLLLAWYAVEARPLAWRATGDPYRVLVSEVMLQQTQVARVEPVYHAFLASFPTVADLAAASRATVLAAWEGLGYNRRAVNLHRAARVVVDEHGGVVPADLAALRTLPGVGGYTARAVHAFAFDGHSAPVDTNVARVLARAVVGRPMGRAQTQATADGLVPAGHAAAWGQALMDLGARYCTARAPRCDACPVAAACAWRCEPELGSEDPARAGSSQGRATGAFVGSDRYHRGRLVDALRRGSVGSDALDAAADLAGDPARLARIVRALVEEGLAEWSGGHLRLPR